MTTASGVADDRGPARDARPRIEVRRVEFDFDAASPKYFVRGEPGPTAFSWALSAVFPDGERFFIDAVRHFRDRIDDPALAKQVQAFVGQEVQHGRVHERYNEHGRNLGFRTDILAKLCRRDLRKLRQEATPGEQLAVTCALEHFTALMAEQVLGNPRMVEGVAAPHVDLWRWHAAEEAEHKAVAYDVYQKVDGRYAQRIRAYLLTSASFATGTLLTTFYLMYEDGTFFDWKAHLGLWKWLLVSPGLARHVVPGWLDYLRPNFHPWDRDDRGLVERWKAEWAPAFDPIGA